MPAQVSPLVSLLIPQIFTLSLSSEAVPGHGAGLAPSGRVPAARVHAARKRRGGRDGSHRSHGGPRSSQPTPGLPGKEMGRTRRASPDQGGRGWHVQRPWGQRACCESQGRREKPVCPEQERGGGGLREGRGGLLSWSALISIGRGMARRHWRIMSKGEGCVLKGQSWPPCAGWPPGARSEPPLALPHGWKAPPLLISGLNVVACHVHGLTWHVTVTCRVGCGCYLNCRERGLIPLSGERTLQAKGGWIFHLRKGAC